jgi:hypothetical protein
MEASKMTKAKYSYKGGGSQFTVEIKAEKHNVSRRVTLFPLIRISDGLVVLVPIRNVQLFGDGSETVLYDKAAGVVPPKGGGYRMQLTEDQYKVVCEKHRQVNGDCGRITVARSNYADGVIGKNWDKHVKEAISDMNKNGVPNPMVKLPTRTAGKPKSRTAATAKATATARAAFKSKTAGVADGAKRVKETSAKSESVAASFRHQLIEDIMDECGERIPQAVLDGFNSKLGVLKRDIISEVTSKLVDDLKPMLESLVEKKVNQMIPPEPIHPCMGQYKSGVSQCDGTGNGTAPCAYRDDCMAVRAAIETSDDPVIVTKFNVRDLIQHGLEILTDPSKV